MGADVQATVMQGAMAIVMLTMLNQDNWGPCMLRIKQLMSFSKVTARAFTHDRSKCVFKTLILFEKKHAF